MTAGRAGFFGILLLSGAGGWEMGTAQGQTVLYVSPTDASYTYFNDASVSVQNSTFALAVLSSGPEGGASAGISSFTNGTVTVSLNNSTVQSSWAYVLQVQSTGGESISYENAGPAGPVTVSNLGTVSAMGQFGPGLSLLAVRSLGGNGLYDGVDPAGGGQGGGAGGNVSVAHSGNLTAGTSNTPVAVEAGFRGIDAFSLGGNAGNAPNGYVGSAAGTVGVTSTGAVSAYLNLSGSGDASIYGILADSQGGTGANSMANEKNGGDGGNGAAVTISHSGGDIVVNANESAFTGTVTGAGIAALSIGGNGGEAWSGSSGNPSYGGWGGAAAYQETTQVTVTDANVTVMGDDLAGILARNTGGNGGGGGYQVNNSFAQQGGAAGAVVVTASVSQGGTAKTISTNGTGAHGIVAGTVGGTGGSTQDYYPTVGGSTGNAANGGGAGSVTVNVSGLLQVQTAGTGSIGVLAYSQGGNGGTGGLLSSIGTGGSAGNGGSGAAGGALTVNLSNGAKVGTTGDGSHGVGASTSGGSGGNGGELQGLLDTNFSAGNGGNGGATNAITLTVDGTSSISTQGNQAVGLAGQSLSGPGGSGGERAQGAGPTGEAGTGGATGLITIANAGNIATSGLNSYGILAQSSSGAGGSSGMASSIFYSSVPPGGVSGSVGTISVTNSGFVSTQGGSAYGMLVQSLAGSGGAAGLSSDDIFSMGGSGTQSANAGTVQVYQTGTIQTTGDTGIGALVQSIGGGGGDGGSATGILTFGGSGGGGGGGGAVTFLADGQVTTSGAQATAVMLQSVGGGGGNGGNATAASAELTISVGGSGGVAGDGGTVTVTGAPTILTQNSTARGILAQSIGGGGGNGGAAYALTVGVEIGGGAAVGGTGGAGGAGNAVSVALTGGTIWTGSFAAPTDPVNTLPTDAIGILAQSVGGGGGSGGSSFATAVAISIPDGENDEVAASVAYSAGGSGGAGGAGGPVSVSLGNGAQLITQGQGSHGILAQSIGGGGGQGGDSSALAATINYTRVTDYGSGHLNTGNDPKNKPDNAGTYSITISMSVGGNGGASSEGGTAAVTLGDGGGSADPTTSVYTYGDYANGIMAQSIGGGGGNAGYGSSTTAGYGTSGEIGVSVVLGSQGSGGGAGGASTLTLENNGVVTTFGSGAMGLLAQSIGGGGGTSQGGMLSFNTGILQGPVFISFNPTINVGATGGAGGAGGAAEAIVNGTVSTYGSDAIAVVVQSIGNGGGVAGGAGADASADNPVVPNLEHTRAFITEVIEKYVPVTISYTLTLGADTAGAGGNGGSASATVGGRITTNGDWAHGVLVQSIGGGGGKAGTAVATGDGVESGVSYQLGGAGGGGDGGTATVTLNNGSVTTGAQVQSVGTGGFSAFGILLQSIGGGGGLASDGSDQASGELKIGDQSGSNYGNGGAVMLTGTGSITTYGEAAHGLVLQSIGGGGGVGGAGSSTQGVVASSVKTELGGSAAAGGVGGTVTIQNAVLSIATHGDNAMGILAQSIGGGGGLGAVVAPNNSDGGIAVNRGALYGGSISIDLGAGSQITTEGFNSYGILAQSIGGGGGISGYTAVGTQITPIVGNVASLSSVGGPVTVTLEKGASLQTSGDYAHGVFVQSIGGGGGLDFLSDGGTGYLYAGSEAMSGGAAGNPISITIAGTVAVTGTGAYGILAQGVGANAFGQPIQIEVSGSVTSNATAVYVYGGTNLVGNGGNYLQVDEGGLVQGEDAAVQVAPVSSSLNVYNYGTITGNFLGYENFGTAQVQGQTQAIQLSNFGRIYMGPRMDADVLNAGVLEVGTTAAGTGGNFQQTVLAGNLAQAKSGTLVVDADFNSRRSDQLLVKGNVNLDGTLLPRVSSVLSGVELPVMKVDGMVEGKLTVDNSGENGGSKIFLYDVVQRGNELNLVATGANFAPGNLGLSANQLAVAGYLGEVFRTSSDPQMGNFFASLDALASAGNGSFSTALNELSPGASLAFGSRAGANSVNFGNQVLNGPVFDGDSATPGEVQSTWARMYGRTASQRVPGGFSDFTANNTIWQVGGQWEAAPDWYVGGSLGYQYDWMNSANGTVSGDGHMGLMAVMAKHEMGAWLFSGAITGSAGWLQTERQITIPGFGAQAHGSPTVQTVGGVLRAAYTFTQPGWYARPMLTGNVIYANSGAYTENGAGPLNLAVKSADQTQLIATPGFEIGARTNFSCGYVLRSYLVGGVSFSTEDSWSQGARFAGAPAGAGDFTTVLPQDDITGRVTAGWQLQTSERTSVYLQYEGEYSENLIGNGGSFGVKVEF